jgi:hypothetical protein
MNLRSILERSGSSLVIIIGIAGSVAVMVSLLGYGLKVSVLLFLIPVRTIG